MVSCRTGIDRQLRYVRRRQLGDQNISGVANVLLVGLTHGMKDLESVCDMTWHGFFRRLSTVMHYVLSCHSNFCVATTLKGSHTNTVCISPAYMGVQLARSICTPGLFLLSSVISAPGRAFEGPAWVWQFLKEGISSVQQLPLRKGIRGRLLGSYLKSSLVAVEFYVLM